MSTHLREPDSTLSVPPALSAREESARHDLEGSVFCGRARNVLLFGFLGMLLAGFCAAWSGCGTFTDATGGRWNTLPSAAALRAFEKHLEGASGLVARLRPWMQAFLIRVFREGNAQVVVSPGGWLFFQKDLDYVYGAPFLDARRQRARAQRDRVATDPFPAVFDFQKQLSRRGIRLILVPVPVKPCIEGHRLAGGAFAQPSLRQNASFGQFLEGLRAGGVEVLDPAPLLFERLQSTSEAQYLARDTHWTPEAMGAVAQALAREVGRGADLAGAAPPILAGEPEMVSNQGDTVALLGLSPDQTVFSAETVQIRPVHAGGMLWQADPRAELLLLGDSFSNIYGMNAMGWGDRAGFAEQLSLALGRPVDTLLRNSDGAFATRQMLQRELVRGRDRLAGKKVVVWEFSVRELAFGDWKPVSLELGSESGLGFYCPRVGERVWVEGTVARVSRVPRPGTVPYREHVMSVQLEDVTVAGGGLGAGKQCLVYAWSMREQKLTRAAFLRAGDRVRWEVGAWEEVQAAREKFQRSEFDEPALLAAPYAWWE